MKVLTKALLTTITLMAFLFLAFGIYLFVKAGDITNKYGGEGVKGNIKPYPH